MLGRCSIPLVLSSRKLAFLSELHIASQEFAPQLCVTSRERHRR